MKPTHKRCARCEQTLPRAEFTAEPRMKSGLKSYCKSCCREYAREHRAANIERTRAVANAAQKRRYTTEWRREQSLKRYGLTPESYAALLRAQGDRCAICHTDTPGGRGNWHIDHCHRSGVVRGLLCSTCNVGIGMFRDDPSLLLSAIGYLQTQGHS